MEFLDLYCVPLLGNNINTFLKVEDQAELAATCRDARHFQIDFVYPMCKTLDLQALYDQSRTPRWVQRHLENTDPHVRVLKPCYDYTFMPPTINTLPNLREITIAVPLILDATHQSIHPTTMIAWAELNRFMRSLTTHPNKLETLRIVPGIVQMVRTNPETREILDSYTVPDREEGSHLRLYRVFELPVALYGFNPEHLTCKNIHAPASLMALSLRTELRKKKAYTDWSGHTQGHISILFDLFAF